MSGQKAYPRGFQQSVQDISGGCCEVCGRPGVTIHHIWGRGAQGKTIHRLWNCIALCFTCHHPGTGKWEDKIVLLDLRLRRLMNYCQRWGKKPNAQWTRLEPGTIANFDEVRQQMKEEGIQGEPW